MRFRTGGHTFVQRVTHASWLCYAGELNNFVKLPILSHSIFFPLYFPATARKTPQAGRELSGECFELDIFLELALIRHTTSSVGVAWRRLLAQFAMLWSCNNIFIGVFCCCSRVCKNLMCNVWGRTLMHGLFYLQFFEYLCYKLTRKKNHLKKVSFQKVK